MLNKLFTLLFTLALVVTLSTTLVAQEGSKEEETKETPAHEKAEHANKGISKRWEGVVGLGRRPCIPKASHRSFRGTFPGIRDVSPDRSGRSNRRIAPFCTSANPGATAGLPASPWRECERNRVQIGGYKDRSRASRHSGSRLAVTDADGVKNLW